MKFIRRFFCEHHGHLKPDEAKPMPPRCINDAVGQYHRVPVECCRCGARKWVEGIKDKNGGHVAAWWG